MRAGSFYLIGFSDSGIQEALHRCAAWLGSKPSLISRRRPSPANAKKKPVTRLLIQSAPGLAARAV